MKGVFLAVGLGMIVGGASAADKPYDYNYTHMIHGVGHATCLQVMTANQAVQDQLDTWADGFITGVNYFSTATPGNSKKKYEMGNIEADYLLNHRAARGVFIRDYCFKNQENTYDAGVAAWVEHIITTPRKQ
ncbi:hypothetical protein [Pseudomonas sp. Hg5Tf]|uniref:Uncharacterized protein n=1 Tax=Pseudomonas sp. Hg7Tf TaxID=3236988 RepID=A0AB39HRM9_9PSED|nr:hypothetical protein [Pseudomonas sp. Hg5Tf]MDH2562234.1 hypothetical protein [Pseudomonas sp. Hg5Tf]